MGILTQFMRDEIEGKAVIRRVQDVEPILDVNKFRRDWLDGYSTDPERDIQHKASIPNVVIEKWLNEEGIDVFNQAHWPRVARKLNDPEWRFLRTSGGDFSVTDDPSRN